MSIFDLQKRQETVQFVLEKRNLAKPPAMRVGVALDVSGSARDLYMSGIMQATIDRLVPIGMRFDDNGEIDVWSFDSSCNQLASVSKHDFDGYIQRAIINNKSISKWGGTEYGNPMQDMLNFYFGAPSVAAKASGFLNKLLGAGKPMDAKPAANPADQNKPVMAMLITDGANSDRAEALRLVQASQNKPIYWQMIGVGSPSEFSFIKNMADDYNNVGFVQLSSLNISDEQLYDALLTQELADFMKKL